MRRAALRPPQAYTITEMLVVLGIIILIASMSLPAIIPMMRGRALRSSAAIVQAALMNTKQYAVTERGPWPCRIEQETDFNNFANPLETYTRLHTYGTEAGVKTVSQSLLPRFIQIWYWKYEGGSLNALPHPSGSLYSLADFQPDGSTSLAATFTATRIYLVDLRTVVDQTQQSQWQTSSTYDEDWNDLIVEINNVTGRVRVVDPDLQ